MSPVGRGVPVVPAVPMSGSVTLTIRGVPASVALALVLAACQEVEGAGGEYLVSREGSDSTAIGAARRRPAGATAHSSCPTSASVCGTACGTPSTPISVREGMPERMPEDFDDDAGLTDEKRWPVYSGNPDDLADVPSAKNSVILRWIAWRAMGMKGPGPRRRVNGGSSAPFRPFGASAPTATSLWSLDECITCRHSLTGTSFCAAMGCLCADHRGPTLSSAEEWRSVALELGDEVKRLNDQSAALSTAALAVVAWGERFRNFIPSILYTAITSDLAAALAAPMKRGHPDAAWWCPKCKAAFELGEAAFTLAANSPPLCPNDGCTSELHAAMAEAGASDV